MLGAQHTASRSMKAPVMYAALACSVKQQCHRVVLALHEQAASLVRCQPATDQLHSFPEAATLVNVCTAEPHQNQSGQATMLSTEHEWSCLPIFTCNQRCTPMSSSQRSSFRMALSDGRHEYLSCRTKVSLHSLQRPFLVCS